MSRSTSTPFGAVEAALAPFIASLIFRERFVKSVTQDGEVGDGGKELSSKTRDHRHDASAPEFDAPTANPGPTTSFRLWVAKVNHNHNILVAVAGGQ